ncbi:MAG: hypothetical protein RR573_10735 [Oscillospiraceae bacterium]
MTLDYVKSEIFNLGFEKESKYKDDKNIIIQAINRAMTTITTEVRPIVSELVINDCSAGCFDLKLLASEQGYEYLALAAIENGAMCELHGYELKRGKILKIKSAEPIHIFYKRAPTVIQADTPDNFVIELDSDVCILLSLLACYYVWLDDDNGRKATIWYNDYETRRNGILSNDKHTVAKVIGGGGYA